jgi:hypothetical protein
MRQEISELRSYHQMSEKMFEILANGDRSDLIINKLQQKEPLTEILEQLGIHSPPVEAVSSSQQRRESLLSDGSGGGSQSRTDYMSPNPDDTELHSFQNGSQWTKLPLSDTVIENLLLLYFCWEYPIFSSLSKRHFVKDFNSGQDRYCSSLLVNGMLAVGCRFSDQIEARMDPNDGDTAGMQFYLEAERLLAVHRGERSVTVIQAMGLMSTWNSSRGDYKKARFYAGQAIRMAVEVGLHLDGDPDELPDDTREVRNTTFWGALMLDQ